MLIESILGAATGIIGNVVGGIFKYKTQKLENDKIKWQNNHELNMVKAETQAMIMESQANIAITKAQIEGEIEVADSNVYLESQKVGNQSFFDNKWIDKLFSVTGWAKVIAIPVGVIVATGFGFIDFLRGIIRPTLTAYLVGLSSFITFKAWEVMQTAGLETFTTDQAVAIFNETTSIMIYLTVSCVTWWFGDRRISKTIMNMQEKKKNPVADEDVTI
jgi:hypothetical protein